MKLKRGTGKKDIKSRKKQPGEKKGLPQNPGAQAAQESIELVLEKKPLNSASTPPVLEKEENVTTEQWGNLAESLKNLSGNKKKPVKARPKAVKKKASTAKTIPLNNVSQTPDDNKDSIKLQVKTSEPEKIDQEPIEQVEKIIKPQSKKAVAASVKKGQPKEEIRRSAKKSEELLYKKEAEERSAFVQQLRVETQSFLQKLAEERKMREVEYQKFREDLRKQLSGQ